MEFDLKALGPIWQNRNLGSDLVISKANPLE